MPDAAWPNLPGYAAFTAADHKAHTTPKGIPRWEDVVPGTKSLKMSKLAMKFVSKPHLKMKSPRRAPARRRKKER